MPDIQETADKILEQRVRRETIVDNRLDGHDRKLASINGQLERGAKAAEIIGERMQSLEQSIVNLRTDLVTKARVDQALKDKADQVVAQQITRREFWMGVMLIVIAIISVTVNAHIFG